MGNTGCRVLCPHRAKVDIQQSFGKGKIPDLRTQNHQLKHDVSLYARAALNNDKRLQGHRQGIMDLIGQKVVEGAQGM